MRSSAEYTFNKRYVSTIKENHDEKNNNNCNNNTNIDTDTSNNVIIRDANRVLTKSNYRHRLTPIAYDLEYVSECAKKN